LSVLLGQPGVASEESLVQLEKFCRGREVADLLGATTCLPAAPYVDRLARSALSSLFPTKAAYLDHRDAAALARVQRDLQYKDKGSEHFHR